MDKVALENKVQTAERLGEIKDEMKQLAQEAIDMVRRLGYDSQIYNRAKGYWYAHIVMALDKEHDFLGGSMCSMQDTIDELTEEAESEEQGLPPGVSREEYEQYRDEDDDTVRALGH